MQFSFVPSLTDVDAEVMGLGARPGPDWVGVDE